MDTKAQKIQNEIYRKMPAKKKLEIAIKLYRMCKSLNSLKNEKIPRVRKFS